MGSDVTYVELSGAWSKATLGLYAGMEPQELDLLVRTALQRSKGACTGFQVTHAPSSFRSSRKQRPFHPLPRLVPLSVACQAPDVLVGQVSALFAPSSAVSLAPKAANEASVTLHDLEQHTLQKGQKEEELHARRWMELVATKVAAIGTTFSNGQAQIQLLALADEIRQNWTMKGTPKRFRDAMELLTMTEKLLEKRVLSEEHGAHLVELVVDEDKALWRALQSCRNGGSSGTDLEMTAKKLAALGWEPPEPMVSKKSKGESPRKGTKQGSGLAKTKAKNAPAVAATPAAVAIVISLHAQHLLTSLELDIIKALIEQEDFQVLQTLRVFKQSNHRDVRAFRDALVSIVEEITMELGDEEKAAAAFARGMDDAAREENLLEDSDEKSGSLEWQRHLRFLLEKWQTQQQLTLADASALHEMVAQRHNLLESAYEVFAGDGDASELLDTLQRVAKLQQQIEQCQGGRNGLNGGPASGVSLEDVVRAMQGRGVLQGGDAAGLLVLFHGENEALQAANEAFQADGDVHELEDTLLLVVKHARFGREEEEDQPVDEDQAICRILSDFGRSERLELWQIQLLISLLKSHDPRLLAAFDVYHEDQETNELAHTLKILVELAAWERHCRAMVHDWIPPLARSGKLSFDRAERLVHMVIARDDRVAAALVVFLSDNNNEEFLDTLVRIASSETDAEAGKPKKGHLVQASLKELEDEGAVSVAERQQAEELVHSVKARMLAAMDVLAATQVLTKMKDQVKDGDGEFEEVKPSSKAAASSVDAEPAANRQKSGKVSDADAMDDESGLQISEESHGDIIAEDEAKEERTRQKKEDQ